MARTAPGWCASQSARAPAGLDHSGDARKPDRGCAADVLAARANGIRSIAVATGIVPREDLRYCTPDLLLEDLRALKPEMLA